MHPAFGYGSIGAAALILIVAVVLLQGGGPFLSEAERHNRAGVNFQNEGQHEKSIEEFTRAIELMSEDETVSNNEEEIAKLAETYRSRCISYILLFEYQSAVEDCDQAIQLAPEKVDLSVPIIGLPKATDRPILAFAYITRCGLYVSMEEPERALEDCEEAILLDSKLALAHLNRGNAYYYLDQVEKAISNYDRAIRLESRNVYNPPQALPYLKRGNAYQMLGQFEKALKDYEEGLLLDPDSYMIQDNKCKTYHGLGELQSALVACNEAINMNQEMASAYAHRCGLYVSMEEPQRALEDCDEAIRLDPRLPYSNRVMANAYENRALAHILLDMESKAWQDFDKAVELGSDPDSLGERIEGL